MFAIVNFDQMIAYITENPNYKYQSKDKTDKIVDTHIEQARNRIENLLKNLQQKKLIQKQMNCCKLFSVKRKL